MKIKGINPVERHAEKIVLGVMALVFLAAIASQFLLEPNAVDAGGRPVPPGQVYEPLTESAQRLQSSLEDTSPSLPEVDTSDLLGAYAQGVEGPVSPAPTLAGAFGPPSAVASGSGLIDIQARPLAALSIPAPSDPVVAAQWNTLDPYAVMGDDALESMLGATAQPYDVVSVGVQGTFDAGAVRGALSDAGVPRKLWQGGGMTALGVEVQRERFADGVWTDAQTLPSDALDAIEALGSAPDATALVGAVRDARSRASGVTQAAFYPTISGRTWVPPREAFEREGRLANASDADRIRDQIVRLEEEIEELGRGGTRRPASSRPSRSSSGSDPRSGNASSRGATTRPNRPAANRGNELTERQIESRRRRIEAFEQRLADLGFAPDAERAARRSASAGDDEATDLFGDEPVEVWSHDIGVEPGEMYRYRLRVVFNNPLYGRSEYLDPEDPEQLAMGERPTVASAWSSWTDAIEVPLRTYLFVTGVSDQNALTGVERVTGEVYTMHYGYYRSSSVSLEPGDAVRGSAEAPETLVVFDTAVASAEDADRALELVSDADGFAAVDLPAGVTVSPARVGFDLGSAFVALRTALGGQGREVVFRDRSGGLQVRSAEEDQGSAYQRVRSSADEGEIALLTRSGELMTRSDPDDPRADPRDARFAAPGRDPNYVDPRDPRARDPRDGP